MRIPVRHGPTWLEGTRQRLNVVCVLKSRLSTDQLPFQLADNYATCKCKAPAGEIQLKQANLLARLPLRVAKCQVAASTRHPAGLPRQRMRNEPATLGSHLTSQHSYW